MPYKPIIEPWCKFVCFSSRLSDEMYIGWIKGALSYQAAIHNLCLQTYHMVDAKCKISINEFIKIIKDKGGKELFLNKTIHPFYMFSWDCACAYFYINKDGIGAFFWASNDNDLSKWLEEQQKEFWYKPEPEGKAYVIIPNQSGLTTRSIGIGAIPLIKENYRPEVIKAFNSVVEDINSSDPIGRLAILDGPPGTGKTYLIRALLNALPKTKFLLLSSNMTDNLGGPDLLSVLIDFANDNNNDCPKTEGEFDLKQTQRTTLVLIIEDADRCLSKRASDNISAISSILNLSDGIIGNLLDLRIVCTTNAEIEDIDPAITRSGRLSSRIEVGMLDKKQAQSVYKRIGGTEPQSWEAKFYTLSDIYAMAKGQVIEPLNKSKCKVGFTV